MAYGWEKPELFTQKIFALGHAEPCLVAHRWTGVGTFGVYHPCKPDQIQAVFDSSAKHNVIFLNNVLLSGPDLNNTLLVVLMCFRKEPIAVEADIEQMFYCFRVCEKHRDYLRFLWFENNDQAKNIAELRMTTHVFGYSPSPSVATYGLRRVALQGEEEHGTEARHFVKELLCWW